jgi:hypothetical protein
MFENCYLICFQFNSNQKYPNRYHYKQAHDATTPKVIKHNVANVLCVVGNDDGGGGGDDDRNTYANTRQHAR